MNVDYTYILTHVKKLSKEITLLQNYPVHSFKTRLGHRLGRGTGSLGQWSNHWVIGRTAWLNRINSD